jgi:hypothetical protein
MQSIKPRRFFTEIRKKLIAPNANVDDNNANNGSCADNRIVRAS